MNEKHLKILRGQIKKLSADNIVFEVIYDQGEGIEFESFPAFFEFVSGNDFDQAGAEWFYPESDEYSSVIFRFDQSDVRGASPENLKAWILQSLEDLLLKKVYSQKYDSE